MFPCAIPVRRADHPRVTHPSAASPLPEGRGFARLACLRRAASVRSEPGSNSPSLIPLSQGQRLFTFSSLRRSLRTRLLYLPSSSFRIDRSLQASILSLPLRSCISKNALSGLPVQSSTLRPDCQAFSVPQAPRLYSAHFPSPCKPLSRLFSQKFFSLSDISFMPKQIFDENFLS